MGERLLEKFDPDYLVRRGDDRFAGLWPIEQAAIKTQDLWDTFARYDYLPMLASQKVLLDTIAWGVERGLFGYVTGSWQQPDKIYFEERVGATQFSDFAWLVRPDHVRPLRYPPPPAIDPIFHEEMGSHGTAETEATGSYDKEDTTSHRSGLHHDVNVEIQLDPLNWRQFYNSVIQPLVTRGANINITVKLNATHGEGFDLDFIELSLKESIVQISRTAKIDLQ